MLCVWNGHKRTPVSSGPAFQLWEHITFVWVQVNSAKVWIHFSLQEFLSFLKSMGWASLVQRNKFDIFSEHLLGSCMWCLFWVALLMCDSSDLQNALVHLGGLIFFFWTFFSNLSLINWDIKIFDALLPFHKVWSAKYLNYIMLKSNNIFCDWNIRNSFPNIKSQLSFSKKQKLCSHFCHFIYLTEQEESVLC